MTHEPRFSSASIRFLKKAGRQKRADWLEKHQQEYEELIRAPLQNLAQNLADRLRPMAPHYHFPLKGIGRLRRSANRVAEWGGGLFKSWLTYSAARPRKSRFEHNPNLYFMIDSDDPDDTVLVAGGLYMPSSKQTRLIREAIALDASAFDRLFATKSFARRFPGGFSLDKTATRSPRGFDPNHPQMKWLKLQAFFVWRSYSMREFSSKDFPALVAGDWEQILRLNYLLEKILEQNWPITAPRKKTRPGFLERVESLEPLKRQMDF